MQRTEKTEYIDKLVTIGYFWLGEENYNCPLTIYHLLKNLELNVLKQLSDYYNNIDVKNYISYQPNDDLFQSSDNIDKITTQMAEYISKNCCN